MFKVVWSVLGYIQSHQWKDRQGKGSPSPLQSNGHDIWAMQCTTGSVRPSSVWSSESSVPRKRMKKTRNQLPTRPNLYGKKFTVLEHLKSQHRNSQRWSQFLERTLPSSILIHMKPAPSCFPILWDLLRLLLPGPPKNQTVLHTRRIEEIWRDCNLLQYVTMCYNMLHLLPGLSMIFHRFHCHKIKAVCHGDIQWLRQESIEVSNSSGSTSLGFKFPSLSCA